MRRSRVAARAPAKVNVFLRVGALRSDGFHDLTTVYHALDLYDEVTATAAPALSVTARGEGVACVPLGGDNLAVRAARALAEAVGIEPLVRLDIAKTIPVAAGLAGGSADAAAALLACDALWGTHLGRQTLDELAAGLGSDVPFALAGGTALGTGRGEQLQSMEVAGDWHWVLAVADGGLSTPAVYREHDRQGAASTTDRLGAGSTTDPLPAVRAALRAGDVAALGAVLDNDLQPAALALRPDLRRILDAGRALGAAGGLVSGSGPTCAFLAASADAAAALATALEAAGVCRAARTARGPAVGASVGAA